MSKSKLVLVLAVIWLLVGMVLLSFYSKFDWDVLLGFATWVLAAGVVFAIWQIIVTRESTNRQLEAARKSTNAQIAVELFRELRGYETLEKFRSIYALKRDDFKDLPTYKKKEIDYVLGKFELVGALAAVKIIDEKLAIEPYGGPAALRCWYILHQYIRRVRDDRGYFCENYEGFTRLCLDYFNKMGIKVKLQREGEEDKELVFQELQKDELRPRTFKEIEKDRKKDNGKV